MNDNINLDLTLPQLSLLINSVVYTMNNLCNSGSDEKELEPYKELEHELRSAILAELVKNDQELGLYK